MKTRILVVEDNESISRDLCGRLRKLDYEVVGPASTGEEGARLAAEGKPDLVLMDVTLGGAIDGVEAARRIRTGSNAALIFLTGHSEDEILERAQSLAPDGYLIKPFGWRDLEVTLRMVIERRRLEAELKDSQARFQAAIAASPDRLVRARRDGSLIDDVVPGRVEEPLPAGVRERVRECVALSLESGALKRLECSSETSGRRWVYELRAAPIGPEEALLIVRDITEQRVAAEEAMRLLHGMNQKLQAAREEERKALADGLVEPARALSALDRELAACAGALAPGRTDEARRLLAQAEADLRRVAARLGAGGGRP